MATTQNQRFERNEHDERRASPVGAYIATAGAVVLLVSVWLNWLTTGPKDSEANPSSGYEGDGVIPLMAYLAVGFALALLYATVRADRRQHRGLSLASFAVGLASLLWTVSFIIDPISTVQYNEGISIEIGPFVAAVGALLWTLGSFLLAKEPEGDFEDGDQKLARPVATHTEARPATATHTETHPVTHAEARPVTHTETPYATRPTATGSGSTGAVGGVTGDDRNQWPGTPTR